LQNPISLGGIPYVMMSELFPLNARNVGMSIASCANWGFNIFVSSTYLSLISLIGIGRTYWLYGLFTILGFVFCYFYVPETKGRSLEDIEENFRKGKHLRELGEA
jgi:MFS transporter, SP family, galactose:H+ symporter